MGQIYLISEGLTREASHQFKQSNTDAHQKSDWCASFFVRFAIAILTSGRQNNFINC